MDRVVDPHGYSTETLLCVKACECAVAADLERPVFLLVPERIADWMDDLDARPRGDAERGNRCPR